MILLKQNTAVTVMLGPFVDSTDAVTPENALTLAQADFRLSKNGGGFAQKSDTTAGAHTENGYYTCVLNATDVNTVGFLLIAVNKGGALAVWKDCVVLPANVYDSIVGGSDRLQVHVDEMTAGIITAAVIAANAFDADALSPDAGTELATALWAATTRTLTGSPISPADIWAHATRTLTGSPISPADIWGHSSRTLTSTLLSAADVWAYGNRSLTNLAGISSFDPATDDVTVGDKAGFKLAPDGLDALSMAEFPGLANTWPEMLVQVWRAFYKKNKMTETQLLRYADDGTTVLVTHALTRSETEEILGAGS